MFQRPLMRSSDINSGYFRQEEQYMYNQQDPRGTAGHAPKIWLQ